MHATQNTIVSIQTRIVADLDPDTSYLDQEEFEERKDQYQRDVFCFVGVNAVAELRINGITQQVYSGGLWGIESDANPEYFHDVANEEATELVYTLSALHFSDDEIYAALARADLDPVWS